MKHVVNLSGGACSFWAADRVAQKYGTSNMVLLFADTLIEDNELYEFNERTAEYFGVPITRVSREMTPWDLFRKEGMIGNDRAPICSIRLKREPLEEWHLRNLTKKNSLFGETDAVIYVGLDALEFDRLEDLRAQYPHWNIEAPMCEWPPVWGKRQMLYELCAKFPGTQIPRAYREGFPHNNCGRRCVRAGITHFVHLFKTDRRRYLDWEEEERQTNEEFKARGIKPKDGLDQFSVLKDRRGGVMKAMTFAQLRERILAGDESLPKDEWGGCGCGVSA